MSATLTVLGAGAILPQPGRGPAGYALRQGADQPVTLLDCGPGSVRMLGTVGIGVEEIERVVLSHFHLDHCLDVFALAFARRNPQLKDVPQLEIIGPPGVAAWLQRSAEALGRWALDPDLTVCEVELDGEGRATVSRSAMRFTAQLNGHTHPALSWRVSLDYGLSLTYSGDTNDDPRVAALARDTDLFLCECSFPDGQGTDNHLTPGQAGALAQSARARRLLLTHFYPGTDPGESKRNAARHFSGPIELAQDGSVHRIQAPDQS
ncbi:MAG: ribonuclease BN (tRNA processing enzyme) [Planctomycetota bacterium]